MGTIVHKSQYTLYFEIFLKTLDTLYHRTEGVYNNIQMFWLETSTRYVFGLDVSYNFM